MCLTAQQINDEFCKEMGLRKIKCVLTNTDTNEQRSYTTLSGIYKPPKNWKHYTYQIFDNPNYPDIITNPNNFCKILNVQWDLFNSIGETYTKTGEETFQEAYIKMRLRAIKLCKSLGGGDGLDTYMDRIKQLKFEF